jgi:hypothetical protein
MVGTEETEEWIRNLGGEHHLSPQTSPCKQENEGGAGKAEVQTYEEIITTHSCRSACVQEDEGGAGEAEVRNADL